mmetsp:Transcript_21409/g.73772  ORF Transcript_21409/g.73772 Transcript_21409/m.73772 type:complete len:204 (-) Transcript_21409:112-723(-)
MSSLASSCRASSCAKVRSSSCFSTMICCAERSSASCLAAMSSIWPPLSSLASMPRSLAAKARFFSEARFLSSSWRTRSARSCSRSSSVSACCSRSSARSRSALSRTRCLASSASSCARRRSASETPTCTSLRTSRSTMRSTSTKLPLSDVPPPNDSLPSPGRGDAPVSCALSRAISSVNSRSMASFGSSLIFGLFLMFFARFA